MARSIAIALTFVALVAGSAYAGIENTIHNLSSTGPLMVLQSDESEICVFCHTPHGGSLTAPLWNRNAPTAGPYTHYTSSTLSTEVAASRSQNIYDESLMCLACHDGSVSMYTVMNFSNASGKQPEPIFAFDGKMRAGAGVRIGEGPNDPNNDLSDDHPISFKYEQVRNDALKPDNVNQLHTIGDAKTAGVMFFGTAGQERVECASCHDPHVDYVAGDPTLKPFLRMANTGSAMCLACHNK